MAEEVHEYVLLEEAADGFIARLIEDATSEIRAALKTVMPTSTSNGGSIPAALVTSVVQNTDGTWPNPVRVGDGARLYQGLPGKAYPKHSDGLRAGDLYVSVGVFRRCLTSDGVTPTSWSELLLSAGTPGGVVTTDPGQTAPVPDDTPDPSLPTPQMTVRPSVLLGSTGVWSSTGSTSLIEALSDQNITGVTAAPSTQGGGVSIRAAVDPLKMESGNDLLVTLWGVTATSDGPVKITLSRGGTQIAVPVERNITTAYELAAEYRWKASDLPILSSWDGLVVEVSKASGGFSSLADVTVQSVPPVTVPSTPGDTPASSSTTFGGVFGSDLRAAPRSIYTDAKVSYLSNAGRIILGCYDDAPMVVTATNTTQRVKVSTSASGGNRADGSGWADSVPIPPTAKTPTNRWKVLLIVSPSTDECWEFVNMVRDATTGAWTCSGGGKITKMSTSKGVMPVGTGITGSGLALAAPRITLDEARKAKQGNVAAIPHTLGLNLPGAFYGANYWSSPATRTDGGLSAATEEAARKTTPLVGDRVRLRKDFDTSKLTGLPRAVAEALKTFGAVIMGGSAKSSLICESGEAEQAASGIEPWGDILAGQGVDQILSWLNTSDLEFVPAGWLSSSSTVSESPMSGGGAVVTPITPPPGGGGDGSAGTSSARIQIHLPAGVKWASGASCRAIENTSEGMGSPFAQWRGEPCYAGRTWWDQPGATPNDTLVGRWGNFHAPMDCGPGFFYRTENMSQAAAGNFIDRWRMQLQQARAWWLSRRDPQRMQCFISPAHEMNGSWYPHSVNSGNVQQFVEAWKRYRELQLQVFPEAILTFNTNRDSSFYGGSDGKGMDWREMVPGIKYGGGKVTDWVDCGAVDYYNMDPHATTLDEFNAHALHYDSFGAPKGIERHRQFWEGLGLCMTVPEWSGKGAVGDWPAYMDGMNQFFRKWAGTGPGRIPLEALFNLSTGFPSGLFAVYADTVVQPNAAARYRALTWGN